MTAQNTFLEHPRYGFTEQRIINETLTSAALTGASVFRRQGMRFAICAGLITITAGAGEVGLIIEGSNDNVNFIGLEARNVVPYHLCSLIWRQAPKVIHIYR